MQPSHPLLPAYTPALIFPSIRVFSNELVLGIRWLKDMSLSKFWEVVKDRESWHAAVYGVAKSQHNLVTEQQRKRGLYEEGNMRFFLEYFVINRVETLPENSILHMNNILEYYIIIIYSRTCSLLYPTTADVFIKFIAHTN